MSQKPTLAETESPSDSLESGQYRVPAPPGFRRLSMADRVDALARVRSLDDDDIAVLESQGALPREVVDAMVENAVAAFEIPMGIATDFTVNDREYVVPMAVEEPSVIAACSLAAKIARAAGGFRASADEALMIGQVQILGCPDLERAQEAIAGSCEEILERANSFHPHLVRRGGGAKGVEVRVIADDEEPGGAQIVVHLLVDTCDAMGANVVNTMAEGVAPLLEHLTRGHAGLRIVSNLADRRVVRASCAIPTEQLAAFDRSGAEIAHGVVRASRLAELDPYRATTHNKGIMNGVDAVAIATGNDWRAIEAGAHAYAARSGVYRPLSTWRVDQGRLVGEIELPLAVGTVGGPARVHPMARLALRIVGTTSARALAQLMAAVGLAQNFAALRVLGSVGIQRGHMALHARAIAKAAGARGEAVETVAARITREGRIRVEAASEVLGEIDGERTGDRPLDAEPTSPIAFGVSAAAAARDLPRDRSSRFVFHVPPGWRSKVARSPHAVAAQTRILEWFAGLGCTEAELARARKFDAAGYVGIPFPELSLETTVRIGKYLSMWLLWDDVQVENLENRWRLDAASVVSGRRPPGLTRFDEGWWSLFCDYAGRRSPAWIADLCAAMATWDEAARREATLMSEWQRRGELPDFGVQLEVRIATIGMYATMYLLEDAYDHEFSRAFHGTPGVRRIKRLANKIVGLGNDVFSLGKDLAERQINLVSTLMSERRVAGDEALEAVIRMHDAALLEYDRVAAALTRRAGAEGAMLERWLRDVRYASLGFSVWESAAPRYTAHKIVSDGTVIEPGFVG